MAVLLCGSGHEGDISTRLEEHTDGGPDVGDPDGEPILRCLPRVVVTQPLGELIELSGSVGEDCVGGLIWLPSVDVGSSETAAERRGDTMGAPESRVVQRRPFLRVHGRDVGPVGHQQVDVVLDELLGPDGRLHGGPMHRIAAFVRIGLGCECGVTLDELPVEGQQSSLVSLSRLIRPECEGQRHNPPPPQLDAWLVYQEAECGRVARPDGHPQRRTRSVPRPRTPVDVGTALDEGLHDGNL
mmetsp:Transcript_36829/g.105535  ORF Transcript_36829/g.105535 Transcript_36829/m.105535 type:complete len:242 (-) Transcript_36829:705-1430(-)